MIGECPADTLIKMLGLRLKRHWIDTVVSLIP